MNQNLFKTCPYLLPQRKIRGLRKYYRNLIIKAENFTLFEDPEHWFDFWHYHVDGKNISNKNWKNRKLHLEALVSIFHQLAKETKVLKIPFQLWILLHKSNGYDDAIFLHTPNPNHDDFPFQNEEIVWGNSEIQDSFSDSFKPFSIRAGVLSDEEFNEKMYYIYSPSIGVSLERTMVNS